MAITHHPRRGPRKARTEPSPCQARILDFIVRYRRAYGYSPTCKEIAGHIGRSKVTVFEHIQALRQKGLLTVSGRHLQRNVRPTGRWSPPKAVERTETRRQRDTLAAACRAALNDGRLNPELRQSIEEALTSAGS